MALMNSIAFSILFLFSNSLYAQNGKRYEPDNYDHAKFSLNAGLDKALTDNLVARCKGLNPPVMVSSIQVQGIDFIHGEERVGFVRRVFSMELVRTKTELADAKAKNNLLAIEFLSKKTDSVQLEVDSLGSAVAGSSKMKYGFFVTCYFVISRKKESSPTTVTFVLDNYGYLMNSGAIDQVIKEALNQLK
jgi:hypothetical protein